MAGQRKRRRTSRILRTLLLAVLAGAAVGVPAAQAAISVGNVSVRETNDDGVVATFRVTRIAPLLAGNTTVGFSTVDGTAHAPADYTAASGLLFFGSSLLGGEQVQLVTVAIRPDSLDEPVETFRILLSGSAEIVDGEGVATIEDDDEPPPPPASPPPPPPDASPPPASAPMGEPPPPAAGDVGAAPPASAPASSDAATAPPRLGLSSPRLRRPSIMLVTVSCPRSTSRCSGRVTIFSRPNPRSRIKALRRERRLGQRNFTLLSGKTRTLTIALSKSDRVRLLRAGRLLVRAYAVTRDANGRSSVRRSSGTLIARTSHS